MSEGVTPIQEGQQSTQQPQAPTGEQQVQQPQTPPAQDPPKLAIEPPKVEAAASLLDFDTITSEYASNGELSEETLKTIETKGIPRQYVDVYMAGLQALQKQTEATTFELVGGSDRYAAMTEWASSNLSKAEIEAFNNAVSSNAETRNLAVQGLFAKFSAVNGQEGAHLAGRASSGVIGYQNWEQVKEAMKDTRYGKDSAYTADVKAKLKNSPL